MTKLALLIGILLAIAPPTSQTVFAAGDQRIAAPAADSLFDTIAALDSAVEQGSHEFCQFATGKCDGRADSVIVWRHHSASWKITRVLSYAHRPLD